MRLCLALVTGVGLTMGLTAYLLRAPLLGIYSSDPQVIQYGGTRMMFICTLYFLCGVMDVMAGMMRGMGYSLMPMIVSLTGACGLRVLWIFTIFAAYHTLPSLYISYPISWLITALAHMACYFAVRRKMPREDLPLDPA